MDGKDIDILISIAYLIVGGIIIVTLQFYLVNKLWFNFDKNKYAEIDKITHSKNDIGMKINLHIIDKMYH